MKTVYKLICVILALLMVTVQLPIVTLAKNESVPSYEAQQTDVESLDGKWKYDIVLDQNDEQRAWITDYLSSAAVGDTFVIPSTIDGLRVQSVEMVLTASVLNAIKNAKKIVLEENVERIAGTFPRAAVASLQIELPSSLLMIDFGVFSNLKITSINFPEGLVAIGETAFQRCTFSENTDIVLPESVRYIGKAAFDTTNITSVKIGAKANFSPANYSQTAGVYFTGKVDYPYTPFSNCSKLTKIEIDEHNPYFKTVDGTVYTEDGKELVFINSYPADYVIPDSVEYVCAGAFNNKTFDSLFISSNIQNFGSVVFSGTIGKLIFADDCAYETIFENNFKNCKIDEVTIPRSVTRIDNAAFYKCGLTKLAFEEDSQLTEIGMKAFSANNITSLDLTDCKYLTKAYQNAFSSNKLLETVDMTDVPMEELSTDMFSGCSVLKEFTISKYTKNIGAQAFEYCYELEDIDLNNIAKFDDTSFRECPKINTGDFFVSSGTTEDGYVYNEFVNHVSLVGYKGEATTLVMPDTVNGKPVTDILWWSNYILKNDWIRSIQFPSHLEYISSNSFDGKTVKEISAFPDTLRFIGERAFYGDYFKEVTLNEGLEVVLSSAFGGCPIQKIVIPDSVFLYAGSDCGSIKNTYFGANCRNIERLFTPPTSVLTTVRVHISDDNPYYCFEDGILYNKDKTRIYKYCNHYNILDYSFDYRIPETVKRIDDNAFAECISYRYLTLPSGVEYIGNNAFYKSVVAKELTVPASVKYIGKNAFSRSSVTNVHFADGFKAQTLDSTFQTCEDLQTVTYGDVDIKELNATFVDSGIKNVEIPESVEVLRSTYYNTDLSGVTELKLPKGLKVLSGAFEYSLLAITDLTIPDGVETIGYYTFERCNKLKTVDFGNVKFIERGAFACCESLETVDLTGITYFSEAQDGSFRDCPNLKKITFNRTDGEYDIDDSANRGNTAIDTVVIGNGIHSVKRKAFADCKSLKTAVISDHVAYISDDAFENCNKLTIVCTENSNAMKYAQRNSINYKTFKIHPVPDQFYTGKEIRPQLTVTVGDSNLTADRDYSVSYRDNIDIGTAKAIAVGLGDYSIYAATVKFNIVQHKHSYHIKTVKPTYAAKGYTLHTCIICGKSYKTDYQAKLTVPKTAISKVTAKKKSFYVKWKKVSATAGYQIQYSTDKSFKSKKTVTVKGAKTTAHTVKKLKGKKKYFVRVRAYKTYKGKNYYSSWSKAKAVKTK